MIFVVVHVGVLIVELFMVLDMIIVPCLVFAPFVVLVAEILLLVECGTMYVTIDIEVSVEVVGAHAIFPLSVVDMQIFL